MSWPPRGLNPESEFSEEQAELLITKGALIFDGLCLRANHTLLRRPRFYATVSLAVAGKQLEASLHRDGSCLLADASLVLSDQPLEQPSMAQCFGALPGTITLDRYINTTSGPRRSEHLPEYKIQPRVIGNLLVLQRLHFLMRKGWDEDVEIAEEFLYTRLVYDPLWQKGAPPQLAKQITVLIAALSNPFWIDFGDPTSQVLANYYDSDNVDVEKHFWHQLLLSVELDLRLRAAGDQEHIMLSHVPEKVAWDLALSKVWLSKMALVPIDEGFLRPATAFHITALTKDIQRERLIGFAHAMKWMDIRNVERMLENDSDGGTVLEFQNAYTSSWITGTILPGESACWLAMRCLIDCDPIITNDPPGFDKMESSFGFQYAGSTYWFFQNVVAKVLGAYRDVNQDYGWVGPCIPSEDLSALQTLLVHAEQVPIRPSKSRIKSMAARSAPLGPPALSYPIYDYMLPLPLAADHTRIVDSVRVQRLAFTARSNLLSLSTRSDDHNNDDDLTTYNVAVVFAVENQIIPIRLRYNVSFIHAPPCRSGPHPLFWDYAYRTIRVDELLLDLRGWNGVFVDDSDNHDDDDDAAAAAAETPSQNSSSSFASSDTFTTSESDQHPPHPHPHHYKSENKEHNNNNSNKKKEKKKKKMHPPPSSILVVQALGVQDNEVLARAWAAHIGFSAVVARRGETCVGCAVRMAYAASVHMVIFGGEGGGQ